MTESNRSMNDVPALIEERRKYEGWLAALATRRDATPPHVFERVLADYQGRLDRVNERLALYRQAIEEERASIQSRVSLLEAEERLRRDERAELELRSHVGELAGEEADTAFRAVDEAVEQLVGEREGLLGRITELQSLLNGGSPSAATRQETPEPLPRITPSTPAHAAPPADSAPATPSPAAAAPATQSEQRNAFDELAFLSSVVGKEEPGPIVERRNTEPLISAAVEHDEGSEQSLLSGLDARRSAGDQPLAANVTANTPIVLRSSTTIEQSKTLKCSECGAMNYPTEWYCERCGAELAAL